MWNSLHYLWFQYFWPSDLGNGPEALQQTVVYGLIALVFVPVVRRFVSREFERAHKKTQYLQEEIHAKLNHIIKNHPDIPDFPGVILPSEKPEVRSDSEE